MAELIGDNDGLVNVPMDTCPPPSPTSYDTFPPPSPNLMQRRSARTVTRMDYSEVKRRVTPKAATKKRKARDAPVAYMDGAGVKRGRLTLAKAIEGGTAAIDRVVGERYEWRDGAYAERRVVVFDDGG